MLLTIKHRKKLIIYSIIFLSFLLFCFGMIYQNQQQNPNGWYHQGTYFIGDDISPGKYYAVADPSIEAYYKICSSGHKKYHSIKYWSNFKKNTCFTVESGDCLVITYANFIKLDKLESSTETIKKENQSDSNVKLHSQTV